MCYIVALTRNCGFSAVGDAYLTPVFYIYMSAAQERLASWRGRGRKLARQEAPVAG